MKQKRKLFIDFDNTLVDTVQALAKMYNEEYRGKDRVSEDIDYQHWDLTELFPLWDENKINEMFNCRFISMYYSGFNGAYSTIKKLRKNFDIYIVSCGECLNLAGKAMWIHNSDLFPKDINVILLTMDNNAQPDKSIIDMSNGILIDDNLTALDTSNAKFKYVFGKEREYNKTNKYKRLETWPDVLELLMPEVDQDGKN